MSTGSARITVLIPTRAEPSRTSSLRRAIESVLGQYDVEAHAHVLVNGPGAEPDLPRSLTDDPRVSLLRRPEADLPAAFQQGVRAVDTPWFASLDDDDELLPGALKVRHSTLMRHPDRTAVVSNGYRSEGGRDVLHVPDGREIQRDPLRALLRRNWLLPGSWLCQTTPRTIALFDRMPRHLECTYLGMRFAEFGMVWLDEPTVRYTVGTPLSASQSRTYVEEQATALTQILELDLPPYARRELRARIAAARHRVANLALQDGAVGRAWRWHLDTLRETAGWRYLPFMRHLVRASLRRRR